MHQNTSRKTGHSLQRFNFFLFFKMTKKKNWTCTICNVQITGLEKRCIKCNQLSPDEIMNKEVMTIIANSVQYHKEKDEAADDK